MQHLALIMDGNRRWARSKSTSIASGYGAGRHAARRAIEFCLKERIRYLSLYAFSLENFNRAPEEQQLLFELFLEVLTAELPELQERGIRVQFIGDRNRFPASLCDEIVHVEEQTQQGEALHLCVLFCYGARQEIVHAVREIAEQVQQGRLAVNDIDEAMIERALWTGGVPHPDLIVRTSGSRRLSNFLLYQAAYSELAFLDCYWPDITEADLARLVAGYKQVRQNYGA